MLIRGNRNLVKAMNRTLLLNIIRREHEVSRKQLIDISGLSMGSVSGIVADLLEQEWILEVGEGAFTGGRRQTLIKLNPSAGQALGIKLMEDRVVVAVTDFESNIIHYQQHELASTSDPYILIQDLVEIIHNTLGATQITMEKLFGVGIGLAGVIDPNLETVHHSPYFGWRDVPLAKLLNDAIRRPVFVENDVNTLTLTAQLFGSGRQHNNFVVMTIGRGIGLGIVINGQLYRGIQGGAGEFGHTVMPAPSNAERNELEFQTLEELAADPAVVAQVQQHLPDLHDSIHTIADVVALADSGNAIAKKALHDSGVLLGAGFANIVNILNPELLIISGEGTIAGPYRFESLKDSLYQNTFNGLLQDVEIVVEPTDDKTWARGAASLVISKMFESPILEASLIS